MFQGYQAAYGGGIGGGQGMYPSLQQPQAQVPPPVPQITNEQVCTNDQVCYHSSYYWISYLFYTYKFANG